MGNVFSGLALIATILGLVILSWILVHIMALMGVFLAITYPVFWLFAPKQTVCLLCRAQKDGAMCPLCRKQIVKRDGVSINNLRSAVLNGAILLVFSFVSLGVVFGESKILSIMGFVSTPKTATFVIPPKGQYRIGEIFPMKLEINSAENAINAVQADIGFDPDKIEVVEVSSKDSFANIFIQKEVNNEGGWARLTGGLPNPGWTGTGGTFGTVYFRGKSPGVVVVNFLPSSMVLANNNAGSNILKELPAVSYLILPDKVTPEEEQEQNKLLTSSNVVGATTDSKQLVFFNTETVLGAHTGATIGKEVKQETNLITTFLTKLEEFDRAILSLWNKVIRK